MERQPNDPASSMNTAPGSDPSASPADAPSKSLFASSSGPGPVGLVLDFFSSVKLGLVLLTALFIYCTIGSAGIVYPTRGPADFSMLGIPFRHEMLRQWRAFELTEFAWFHTWVFNLLIALICVNLTVTTLRRIRLNAVNAGVWMIHSGIIILCVGSVIYFTLKVEGDAPVIRRRVTISVPGLPVGSIPALPGSGTAIATPDGDYEFQVVSIDPRWELRTEGDIGKTAYAVTVRVRTPQAEFMRQLLDGYPEYTEDVIQGKGRVKKLPEFEGRALVDESLSLGLDYQAQDTFWLKDTAAVYVREAGESAWAQRPVQDMPRYNDSVQDTSEVWPAPPDRTGRPFRAHPLSIMVPPADPSLPQRPGAADPLANASVRVTGFLRYAVVQRGFEPGGDTLFPVLEGTLTDASGSPRNLQLIALDPRLQSDASGVVSFVWAANAEEAAQATAASPCVLTIRVADGGPAQTISFTQADVAAQPAELKPLGESGWAYRIRELVEGLPLQTGERITLAILDVKNPEGESFTRWVFEDPVRNRDNRDSKPEEAHKPSLPDPRLLTEFEPGASVGPVVIIAGPEPVGLRVSALGPDGQRVEQPVQPGGGAIDLGAGRTLAIRRLLQNAQPVSKPMIIPWQQRDQDADTAQLFALVQVEVSAGGRVERRWVPFHRYSFDDPNEAFATLSRYEPAEFSLADGRRVELMVSRESRPLPAPVILDDFILTTHIGGFTGRTSSIRDWTSVVRFREKTGDATAWSQPLSVSTNNPKEFAGLSYFQSFWDAPRAPRGPGEVASAGLNFTGLGVGNRYGVITQLAGSCIAVFGMFYAFYVKPIIKRRRRAAVLAELDAHARQRGAWGQPGQLQHQVHTNGDRS